MSKQTISPIPTMGKSAIVLLLITCIIALTSQAQADDVTNPHLLKPKIRSASVFKNGLGFFMREGSAVTRDGWVLAEEIPAAKFGTLMIYSLDAPDKIDIVGAGQGEVVDFDDVDQPNDPAAKRTRLSATKGLRVELHYRENGKPRNAQGKLVSVGAEFAIVDTGTQSIAIPVATISRMKTLNMPLRIHVDSEKKKKPNEKSSIGIAYLSSGITWIPEYSVKIIDKDTAELTLRGTLVNDAEDLIHADVNFVVGVPHFAHQGFLAPIAVGQTMRTIGTAVAPAALRGQIMNRAALVSNYNTSNQFTSSKAKLAHRPPAGASISIPNMKSPAASDYTVNTKKDMTLRRGERAIVTLMTQKIRYTHIYRWQTTQRMQHFLQLHNDSDIAWTTGPYLAMAGGRPLSEDLLKYTPAGGCGEIPVTAAVNVAHSSTQKETSRKLKAYQPDKYKFWDLVTLTGEVKLRNFEKEPVEIVITAPMTGKPIEASDDGSLAIDSTKLKLLERQGTVTWTITLKSGESKTLTYTYERYIPSQ